MFRYAWWWFASADAFDDRTDAPVIERSQTRKQLHSQGGPVC